MTSAYVYRAIMVSLSNHDCVGRGEPDFRIALVRLIAAIHYNRQKVYIRAILTHEEYDKGKWKG